MKIEPFENINSETEKIDVTNSSTSTNIGSALLKLLTPEMLTNFSKIFLPLMNNFNKEKNEIKEDKNTIVETNEYKEIQDDKKTKNIEDINLDRLQDSTEFPTNNPQLSLTNFFNLSDKDHNKEKAKILNHTQHKEFINYNYKIRQQVIRNKIEEHRKYINLLNKDNIKIK